MNNYSNPMVTYDEIVDALRAIIDCSKANGYLEEYGFLNVKYDSLNQNPIQKEQEQALLKALQSLEKTLNAANKVIRENLEKELAEISAVNIFKISSTYEHSGEKRKLASQNELVMRLKEMSLPLEVLSKVEQPIVETIETIDELPTGFEEITEEVPQEEPEVVVEEPVEEIVKPLAKEVQVEETIEEEPEVQVETVVQEENVIEEKKEEPNKIQLIRKALEKAREKGNEQLVKVLEIQLNKELENLK